MKITKEELIEIIKEEVDRVLKQNIEEEEQGSEDETVQWKKFPKGMRAGQWHDRSTNDPIRIPFSKREMEAFFKGGGGIDALEEHPKFQNSDHALQLMILKIARKFIKRAAASETKKWRKYAASETKKWRKLYRKNHSNLKGMRRKMARYHSGERPGKK